jgi:hypothetical protein
MKIKVWYFLFLLLLAACKNDNNSRLFWYNVNDGEAQLIANTSVPSVGATVEVYSSAQAWIDGAASIKTFTTGSKGSYESNDVFSSNAVFFAKNGTSNNWPYFLSDQLKSDPNIAGGFSGYTAIYNTFMQNFATASGKTYLLSDVRVNTVSIFANVSACSKDNYITLTKDAKIIYSEGANVCAGKTPTQTFVLSLINGTHAASETTINGVIVWRFNVTWPDVQNTVYIKKDFSQILFSDNIQTVTIYTLQK